MIKRRASKVIRIGGVEIGGAGPIVVQSMTKTDTRDVKATVKQIRRLEECGCEIVRVAVPDMDAARAIVDIKKRIEIPLIADIHFDHRLALEALKSGADGLRLNPGNISDPEHISAVVRAAKDNRIDQGIRCHNSVDVLLYKIVGPGAIEFVVLEKRHPHGTRFLHHRDIGE